jgi:organic radical activating enzyme
MNINSTANSLANNSDKRIKKEATPFSGTSYRKISELTISVTNKCNLTCKGCGFDVPNQISPVIGGSIDQHIESLVLLKSIGVKLGKLVIVGGEAALVKSLSDYISKIKSLGVADKIELVTNGLYPKGVTKQVLEQLDSLVISDYVCTESFESDWNNYLNYFGYMGEVDFRRKDAWDDLFGEVDNDYLETKEHWKHCFYRKYDVTLERGRLFSCSRIAKKNWDEQGLLINTETSIDSIKEYLTSNQPKKACYSCATVGACSQIPVAEQVNSDLVKISNKAMAFLREVTKNG